MKLIGITVVVFIVCSMGLMTARFYGQSKSYGQYQHPFWSDANDREFLVTPWEQNFILEKRPEWILWIDVQQSKSEQLLARPWIERKTGSPKEFETNPSRPEVSELLSKFPNTRFILNIVDNKPEIHLRTIQLIKSAQAADRVVINSDFPIVLEATKKEEPSYLYGSSLSDFTRFKTFESLFILPATPLKGDFLIGPLKHRDVALFSNAIVSEVHRRHKKVIIGPLEDIQQIGAAEEFNPDGLFVTDPLLLIR